MREYFTASIKWVSYAAGGRMNVPGEGTRYCPLIGINKPLDHGAWSIDFVCPDFHKTNVITFQFLVDTAPSYLLAKNAIYELFEGDKRVAEIRILDRKPEAK